MTKPNEIPRVETGVPNLDALLEGGLPRGAVIVVAGAPGSGKTILAQQIAFASASPERRVLYFSTLSEPTAKTLRYLQPFGFFDRKKMEGAIEFIDLGLLVRASGLEETATLILEHLKRVKPALVVIDSFKVFDEMARTPDELRRFDYRLAISLMAWETTTLLLEESGRKEIERNPLFAIMDGLLLLSQREEAGEEQRFLQVLKMRGTDHSRDEHPFVIRSSGIEVFAPRVTIQRAAAAEPDTALPARLKTGIAKLDDLLGEGIPRGSSLLIGGVAGTGKTVLLLECLYRGALEGEKGIIFSFEETPERLLSAARGLGWDFDRQVKLGMIEIVFIPQPNIMVEEHLSMMAARIKALKARRVAVDSLSVFLHKIKAPQICREKTFQLASIVQNTGAVGLFATDIPYGTLQISRYGVEETVVDGIILLSSSEEGFERQRYLEVYKLRNTAHLKGRHNMTIGPNGITVYPRYLADLDELNAPLPSLDITRLPSGVPGLDALVGGGLLQRSVTLVSGSAGVGKSTLALQFILEGMKRGEPGLYVTLEEGPAQILKTAVTMGLPLQEGVDRGLVELTYLSLQHVRANQFLTILADLIQARKTRRLVLDSVSHLATGGIALEELRRLLFALATRFKGLGLTSVFTIESSEMHDLEDQTARHFSQIADNLVVLRYERLPGELRPYLSVVKTRGSAHDRGLYSFTIGEGGLRIGARTGTAGSGPKG